MSYILILGAKSDIAIATAHEYAKNGFDLYLACRKHAEIQNIASDMEIRYGIKAKTLEFDALKYKSHEKFYNSIKEKPVGAVCAFGYLGEQEDAQKDFEESMKIIETNYTGCASILNIIANDFESRNDGFIIGISSVAGDRGRQSNYIYGSAKAAFTAYLSGLRGRLSKSNVNVLTVKPGFVRTQMTDALDLPDLITAEPEETARDIYKAWKKGKSVLYTKWFWRYIMLIIIHIPEAIFKKLSL